jgi:hypothetical protein
MGTLHNDNIIKREALVITGVNQFNELLQLIHDEYFELDDIKYTAEQNMVQIPCSCHYLS